MKKRLLKFLEGAPSEAQAVEGLIGWNIQEGGESGYVCASCAARILARGCQLGVHFMNGKYLPNLASVVVPVWDSYEKQAAGVCVCCDEIKIRSAINTRVSGVVVGVTLDQSLIIFHKDDYDNRGTLKGAFKDVGDIAGRNGFYLLSSHYSPDAMKRLNFTTEAQKALMDIAEQFASDHVKANASKRGRFVCADCGSPDVSTDASAYWDNEAQAWALGDVYDTGKGGCSGECSSGDVRLRWEYIS